MTQREISALKESLEENLYEACCSDMRKTRSLNRAREIMAVMEKENTVDIEEYRELFDSLCLTSSVS